MPRLGGLFVTAFCRAHRVALSVAPSVALCCALAGCASPPSAQTGMPAGAVSPAPSATLPPPSATPTPPNTPTPSASPTQAPPSATPTQAQPSFSLCSPLEGITLAELGGPDLLKNPFMAPKPGKDDGHHGADFAYWSRGERKEMLGLPVYSVLDGRVAGVILNRPPYGNAVLIETPLERIPANLLDQLGAPTPAPTVVPDTSLYCPANTDTGEAQPLPRDRSLYLLYAHLNQAPLVEPGQSVTCGQALGEVGTTGRSVNPHLHLETRVGPAGQSFPAMAHYENSITEEEMRGYCTWRVSGLFQLFDPMQLISLQP